MNTEGPGRSPNLDRTVSIKIVPPSAMALPFRTAQMRLSMLRATSTLSSKRLFSNIPRNKGTGDTKKGPAHVRRPFPIPFDIGTDICHVPRIAALMKRDRTRARKFIKKVLTEGEIESSVLWGKWGMATVLEQLESGPRLGHRYNKGRSGRSMIGDFDNPKNMDEQVMGHANEILDANMKENSVERESAAKELDGNFEREENGDFFSTHLEGLSTYIGGRWAIKEAVIKAHPHVRLTMQDITIEVPVNENGMSSRPRAWIRMPTKISIAGENVLEDNFQEREVMISLSHDGDYATAICLAAADEAYSPERNSTSITPIPWPHLYGSQPLSPPPSGPTFTVSDNGNLHNPVVPKSEFSTIFSEFLKDPAMPNLQGGYNNSVGRNRLNGACERGLEKFGMKASSKEAGKGRVRKVNAKGPEVNPSDLMVKVTKLPHDATTKQLFNLFVAFELVRAYIPANQPISSTRVGYLSLRSKINAQALLKFYKSKMLLGNGAWPRLGKHLLELYPGEKSGHIELPGELKSKRIVDSQQVELVTEVRATGEP